MDDAVSRLHLITCPIQILYGIRVYLSIKWLNIQDKMVGVSLDDLEVEFGGFNINIDEQVMRDDYKSLFFQDRLKSKGT